jgi:cellobiose phosphorylase
MPAKKKNTVKAALQKKSDKTSPAKSVPTKKGSPYVYGDFALDGRTFQITRTDTPRPWLNYPSNEAYGVCLSQLGYGYSFYMAEMGVRVTHTDIHAYVPTHPRTGRFIFVRNHAEKTGRPLWPMTDAEAKYYSGYVCNQGLGWTEIKAERDGIKAEVHWTVPTTENDPVEIWRVRLTNTGKKPMRLSVFPFVEWCLSCPPFTYTDLFAYNRAFYDKGCKAIRAVMSNPEACLRYSAFMTADYEPVGWDCQRDEFLGRNAVLTNPAAADRGKCANSDGMCEYLVGVLQNDLNLKPGGSTEFHLLLGVADDAETVNRFRKKYLAPEAPAKVNRAVQKWYDGILGTALVHTPEPQFDLLSNVWLKYQLLHTARWTRGLDRGYRDILQDCMGVAGYWPEYVRKRLLQTLRFQYRDGTAMRQWSEISSAHDFRRHRDSPSWIIWTLEQYLLHTGDFDFLKERVPYFDGGEASVYEHALNGVRVLFAERGAHGMCLIGDGDWNDALNEIGKGGKGESVWLTCAAVCAAQKCKRLATFLGDDEVIQEFDARIEELQRQINDQAWLDGQYVYAFADDGTPVGAPHEKEGRIHLNVQTWAIFTDTASPERKKALFNLIDETMETEYGPVLIHPAYTQYNPRIGRITGMVPGMFENGAVYNHGVAMMAMADCREHRGEKAFARWWKAQPMNPTHDRDRFSVEPYAATNFVMGPSNKQRFGSALYSWHSGSTAWFYLLAHQYIVGIRPEYDGLRIDPCVPRRWKKFGGRLTFRKATYEIEIENPKGLEFGVTMLTVDGKTIRGNKLPLFGDGNVHSVKALMG